MDFYKILEVNKNATKKEIKNSYHKLALKYHPDKNKNNDSTEKFRNINIAYETLYDDNKRREYDSLSYNQKMELYNLFQEYFDSISPEYKYIYNNIISSLYTDKDEFKKDLNNFNFINIYDKFKVNTSCGYSNLFKKVLGLNINDNKDNNSYKINIECTLLERYE